MFSAAKTYHKDLNLFQIKIFVLAGGGGTGLCSIDVYFQFCPLPPPLLLTLWGGGVIVGLQGWGWQVGCLNPRVRHLQKFINENNEMK